MPTTSERTSFEIFKKDRASTTLGQVSAEPLTWTVPNAVTVGAASGELIAAASGNGRLVQIKVPTTATTGIHINFGAAATTSKMFVEPGERVTYSTEQQVTAIRGGASDVTVYVASAVV